jgi:hypothetical protein
VKGKKITELYAWIATEPDGGEGVCAAATTEGWLPMIGADMDRMRSLRPAAELAHKVNNAPIRLVRFSTREDLEELP